MSEENEVEIDDLRNERIRRLREWYTSEEGFLDFVRDSGAAPDAVYEPHGRYCDDIIHFNGTPDPDTGMMNYKGKLVLWPRGSFKSQVFNVGRNAWKIACNPNVRILVTSETNRQAKKFVQETMKIIDSEWFKELFGDHTQAEWKPGTGVFTSSLRTRKGVKDPTLCASGVGEVQTGAHWDEITLDDICSQENTKTPDSIEGLWTWFGEIKAQLDPGGCLFMIGTLHHYSDIYCKIMSNPELAKDFDISKYAWSYPIVDPNLSEEAAPATLFFPSRLSRTYVAAQKRSMPGRLYACFYENQPRSEDQQIFRPDYFRTIPDESIPPNCWTYICTDFAFIADEKRNARADRTVFWVVSLDVNRVAYVRDVVVGRFKPSDSVRLACSLWNQYQWANLKGMTVEKTCYNELLSSVFEEVRRQTHVMPKFITIGGRSQEVKDMRIEAAEPRWAAGDIYFAQSIRDQWRKWKPMFDEMTQWPFSTHDDIPDAISDLDKKDESNPHHPIFHCPHPPVGWAQSPVQRYQPPLINGSFNPDLGYPARETTKANQQGHDLWRSRPSDQGQAQTGQHPEPDNSFFQSPAKPPTQWP